MHNNKCHAVRKVYYIHFIFFSKGIRYYVILQKFGDTVIILFSSSIVIIIEKSKVNSQELK